MSKTDCVQIELAVGVNVRH